MFPLVQCRKGRLPEEGYLNGHGRVIRRWLYWLCAAVTKIEESNLKWWGSLFWFVVSEGAWLLGSVPWVTHHGSRSMWWRSHLLLFQVPTDLSFLFLYYHIMSIITCVILCTTYFIYMYVFLYFAYPSFS